MVQPVLEQENPSCQQAPFHLSSRGLIEFHLQYIPFQVNHSTVMRFPVTRHIICTFTLQNGGIMSESPKVRFTISCIVVSMP